MSDIHPSALVHKKARIADDVRVGPFSIIEEDVEIGPGCDIHSHVLAASGTRLGPNCTVHHGTVLGTLPQDLKFAGEKTTFEVGENTVIREFCALNRGTSQSGRTSIGKNCFLMAYTHLGHDCHLGDHVILANGVQLGGHVTIEDWVIIGGLTAVHQFVSIGQHAFVGGGFRAVQDIPPYVLVAGEPLTYKGLNAVGLKRRGFEKDTISGLRQCYRIIYRSRLNTTQALQRIRSEMEISPEIEAVLQFIDKSERGIVR